MVPVDRHAAPCAADHSERHQSAPLRDTEGHNGGEEKRDPEGTPPSRVGTIAADCGAGAPDAQQADGDDRRCCSPGGQRAREATSRRGASPVILVVAEHRDGRLNRATLETIAAAQKPAGNAPIKAVVFGQSVATVAQELATSVSEVLLAEHAALATYTP